jgi:hypothetical protein
MKKERTLIVLLFACIAMTAIQACKKNGNVGQAVFWNDKATADSVLAHFPVETLTYRVKNGPNSHFSVDTVLATQVNTTYWPTPAPCGHPSSITFALDMGSENNEPMLYIVTRPNGSNLWSGSFNLNGGACSSIQLTYP